MALKDLVSDLSNFNGSSQYDKLDSQIKEGVDFFPNDDASGFTPKTDLESLYKKANTAVGATDFIPASDGTFGETWPGIAPKNQKTRQAYGKQGEYEAGDRVGRAIPNILGGNTGGTDYNLKFGGDSLGTPWSPDYPRIKGIDDYVSLIRTTGFENSKLSLVSIPKLFTAQDFENVNISGIRIPKNYEKQRGVFDEYPMFKFKYDGGESSVNINKRRGKKQRSGDTRVGSIHISPAGEIKAGLRYGAMTNQTFKDYFQGSKLIDLASAVWPDNVSSVNIFPITDRTSQWSAGSSFNSTTMNIPATYTSIAYKQTGYADRTVYGNTVSSLEDLFRGSELWSQYHKDKIDELIKFKDGNFIGLPTGWDENSSKINVGTTDFRTAANTGPHKGGAHPLILRPISTKWGSDNSISYKPDGVSQFNVGNFFGGVNSFNTLLERTAVDRERITKWLSTEPGKIFNDKQHKLQMLNPTIESKLYNPNSLIGIGSSNIKIADGFQKILNEFSRHSNRTTIGEIMNFKNMIKGLPVYHAERHKPIVLGEDYDITFGKLSDFVGVNIPPITFGLPDRYDGMINLTNYNYDGNKLNGRVAWQAKAFSSDLAVYDWGISWDTPTDNWVVQQFQNLYNTAIDKIQNAIRTTAVVWNGFPLSNPNRYFNVLGTTAPVSIHNGIPSFVFNPWQARFDVAKALNRRGSTFNVDSSKAASKGGNIKNESITHASLPYSMLHKTFAYDNSTNNGKLKGPEDLITIKKGRKFADSEIQAPWTTPTDKWVKRSKDKGKVFAIGNPGQTDTHSQEHEELGRIKINGAGGYNSDNTDKINMIPYGLDYSKDDDFIKFRFEDMVNDKWIIFRAILEGISDSITPEYGEERYIGRPDKVYTYQGADRSISFTFSIYPKTKQELPVLMEKLNYLVGLCYPSKFTSKERMITPFITLTLGDMFVKAPGLLWSLNVSVEDTSTWEIEDGLQFPHYIKAQCEFKYLGNNVLTGQGKHYGLDWIPDGSKGNVPGTPANDNGTGGTPPLNRFDNPDDLGFTHRPTRTRFNSMFDKINPPE